MSLSDRFGATHNVALVLPAEIVIAWERRVREAANALHYAASGDSEEFRQAWWLRDVADQIEEFALAGKDEREAGERIAAQAASQHARAREEEPCGT